jgi:YD repeat-containing protein
MVGPDGGTTTYAYDARNALSSLVNPLSGRTTWQYDVLGRIVTQTYASGSRAVWAYDAASRATQLVNAKSSGVTITSHAYSFDAVGNPVGMAEANGDVLTWTYDALNRLAREQRSGGNAFDMTYSYDPVGNRATKVSGGVTTTYSYDAASELTLEDAAGTLTTYSYDENGNTLAWNANGSRTTLTWGYEDGVLTVQTAAGVVTMIYDGDHMCRKRQDASCTAKYVWDGAQVLLDTDAGDATVARYTLAAASGARVCPCAFPRNAGRASSGRNRRPHCSSTPAGPLQCHRLRPTALATHCASGDHPGNAFSPAECACPGLLSRADQRSRIPA